MKRKLLVGIISLAAILAIVAGTAYVLHTRHAGEQVVGVPEEKTDAYDVFQDDVPRADSLIVGKWQNDDNPQWFKVYYDDYDEDGYFWGKEWDESEDVREVDLNYHGNGWFRWCKNGKKLIEIHLMDAQDVPIPKVWNIHLRSLPDRLILTNSEDDKQCYRFERM